MSQAKYHAGDRVLIVPELTGSMTKMMGMYCNRIMTIGTVLKCHSCVAYRMVEDRGYWYWRDEDIVGRIVKKKQYKIGDTVLVRVAGWHEIKTRTIKDVLILGGAYYLYEETDGDARCHHRMIEGCLERPEEPAPERNAASDLNRGHWTETITIQSDGTHTEASLIRTGSNPASCEVSLRRDSRDTHDLYAVAQLALGKLRDKDYKKETPSLFTGDVFCVDSSGMSDLYTTGKIYSVKGGVLVANDRNQIVGIRSFQWLQEKSLAKWMEVVK